MRFAIAAIVLAGITPPPCSQQQELTPDQAQVGAVFDQQQLAPLVPGTHAVLGARQITFPHQWANAAEATRMRIQMGLCSSHRAVVGVVRSRTFLLTPQRRFIFGVYTFNVENTLRGKRLDPGTTITLARGGGEVCTTDGQLSAQDQDAAPFEVGERYLLFLAVPEHGHHMTSPYDWHLDFGGLATKASLIGSSLTFEEDIISTVEGLSCE